MRCDGYAYAGLRSAAYAIRQRAVCSPMPGEGFRSGRWRLRGAKRLDVISFQLFFIDFTGIFHGFDMFLYVLGRL